MKLRDLAAALGGTVDGDGDVEVTAVAELDTAGPGAIVMVRDRHRLAPAAGGHASALLLAIGMPGAGKPAIRVPDVRVAFAETIALLHPPPSIRPGRHPTAMVGEGTHVGTDVTLGPHVVVGGHCLLGDGVIILAGCVIGDDVVIGTRTTLYPRVTVYPRTQIGARVMIHSGAVLGSDGFGYAQAADRHVKIPHVGRVVIEDDVEIGANTTIDRATLGETRIGRGTKIDNLVQIAHNCRIGADVIIAGQTGVSGSATIGDGAMLAGQVGVVDHVTIGERATVLGRSVVTKDVPAGAVVSGDPAQPHRDVLKQTAAQRRLTELLERVSALERRRGGRSGGAS